MAHVVFVAPFFLPATLRFVHSVSHLQGIRFSLISCDRMENLPQSIRKNLTGHYQVGNCMDPGQLAIAAKSLASQHGPIHRLFGALEEMQVPIAKVRDYLGIEGLGAAAANNFRDKSEMKTLLRANGIPCARHCLASSAEQAWAFIGEVGFPIVIKPPAGAGARNTFEVKSKEELQDYLNVYGLTPANPTLLEEFIQGDEHSFDAVSIRGQVVWHSLTRYYPSPLEVLKNPFLKWVILLPRDIDAPRFNDIRAVNAKTLSVLGMKTGITHLEWFRRRDNSVAVSEVAARPPGAQIMTLMSYAHDKNFYNAWAELMVFDRFQIPERRYAAGAAFLRGAGSGRVKAVHGLAQAQKEVGSLVVEAKLPQIGQPSASGYEGEGYVLVRHEDTEIVKKALHRLVSLIQVEYE